MTDCPGWYRELLGRFRYGPGVFKLDWALDGPVPWTDPALARAGTVHLGGTLAEVRAAERDVVEGRHPDEPFMLLAQQSLFDPTRAPGGQAHALGLLPRPVRVDGRHDRARWRARIERFAPGLPRSGPGPAHARHGAVRGRTTPTTSGATSTPVIIDLRQFAFRPVPSLNPWTTPADGLYLCSSSTPPGGGVHGMCGFKAAQAALRRQPL